MFRLLFFVCLLACLSSATAQDNPYESYLNEGKRGRGNPAASTSGAHDFRDRYLQDIGASFNGFNDQGGTLLLPGIQYIGRYHLVEKNDKLAWGISTHPSLGFQVDQFFGSFFMLNLPVMVEGTVGRGSSLFNEQMAGLSLGVGPEFNLLNRFTQFGVSGAATFRFRLGGRGYFIRYSTSLIRPTAGVYISSISLGNSIF